MTGVWVRLITPGWGFIILFINERRKKKDGLDGGGRKKGHLRRSEEEKKRRNITLIYEIAAIPVARNQFLCINYSYFVLVIQYSGESGGGGGVIEHVILRLNGGGRSEGYKKQKQRINH